MLKITSGEILAPSKDVIHGVEGVGKTTLASTYPEALFFDIEKSTRRLAVRRLTITTYAEFIEACHLLINNKQAYRGFKTVIIDTVDWLEKLVIAEVVRLDKATSITDQNLYSYGKGDLRVKCFIDDNIIPLLNRINETRNVVLLAHSVIKTFTAPNEAAYDFWGFDMGKKSAATFRQWADNVFFINYKTIVKESRGIVKNQAFGGHEVFVYTQRRPQYEAKRRYDLQDEIKVEKGVMPYPQIIGTTLLYNEAIEGLPTRLNEVKAAKTSEEVGMLWNLNKILHECKEYETAIKKKGSSLKTKEAKGAKKAEETTQTPAA